MAARNISDSREDLEEDLGFSNYFTHLLNTKKCVDVTFVLQVQGGEVEFCAHQFILAMRSPHFADRFYGDQRDKKHHIIRLEKVNPKAFEDMIRYCYGCKPALETIDEISALVRTASQFDIKSLTSVCLACLRDAEITPENVFSILEVSEFLQDENLSGMCYKFLENNTGRVIAAHDLPNVTATMVQNIVDLRKLWLNSEYELIKWIFDWAKVKSEEVSAGRSPREYLEKFLKALNFLALTSQDFALLCKEYPDFLFLEEIASISLNITLSGSREMPSWYDKSMKLREYSIKELDTEIEHTKKHLEKRIADLKECDEILLLFQTYKSIKNSGSYFARLPLVGGFRKFSVGDEIIKLMEVLDVLKVGVCNIGKIRELLKELIYDKRLEESSKSNLSNAVLSILPVGIYPDVEQTIRQYVEIEHLVKKISLEIESNRKALKGLIGIFQEKLCQLNKKKI